MKRIISKLAALIAAAVLALPVPVYASIVPVTANIQIYETNLGGTVTVTSADTNKADSVSVPTKDSASVLYTYSEPGVYSYKVTQKDADASAAKKDDTTYTVTVYVNQDDNEKLSAFVVAFADGTKKEKVAFNNTEKPAPTKPNSTSPAPQPGKDTVEYNVPEKQKNEEKSNEQNDNAAELITEAEREEKKNDEEAVPQDKHASSFSTGDRSKIGEWAVIMVCALIGTIFGFLCSCWQRKEAEEKKMFDADKKKKESGRDSDADEKSLDEDKNAESTDDGSTDDETNPDASGKNEKK